MTSNAIGRDHETTVLLEHLERLCNGEGGSLLLLGDAGYGKTTLTKLVAAEASERGIRVLSGRARPENEFLGYGLLTEVFGGECLDYARSNDSLPPLLGLGQKANLVQDSFVDCVAHLAADGPLLVILEDIDHADTASVRLLAQSAPRLGSFQVLWLLTSRPSLSIDLSAGHTVGATGMPGDWLGHLLTASVQEVVTLSALLAPDVAALAESVIGDQPGPRLLTYLARAQGNPLHIAELCKFLREEGWVSPVPGSDHVVDIPADTPIPRGFRALVDRATGHLPGTTRRLLQLASVLGTTAPLASVADLAAISVDELLRGLRPAIDAGLMTVHVQELRFRHELVRDAVYESLPLSVRLATHNEVGRRMMEMHERSDHLAWHHMLAQVPPASQVQDPPGPARDRDAETSDELLRLLSSDALDNANNSPDTVSDLLGAALSAVPTGDPQSLRLLVHKAWAEMAAGAIQAGETAAEVILEATKDPSERIEALELLAESLTLQRRYADAVEPLTSALDIESDQATRERLRASRGHILAMAGDLLGGMSEVREVHETTDSPSTRAGAAASLALGHTVQGQLAEALPLAQSAVEFETAQEWGDPRNRCSGHFVLGLCLLNADEWDRGSEVIGQGIRSCEERGLLVDLPLYLSLRASLLLMQGEWADAVAEAETGLAIATSLNCKRNVVLMLDVLAYVAAQRGERATAADALRQAERIVPLPTVLIGPNRIVRTKVELLTDPIESLNLLRAGWAVANQVDAGCQLLELGPTYVTAARDSEDTDMLEASRRVGQSAARFGTNYARGTAARCEGIVRNDVEALHRAVSLMRRSPRLLDLADTLMDLAKLSSGTRQRTLARDSAQEALETYRRFGAHTSAGAATAFLADVGATARSTTIPQARVADRPATGWDSLTRTERTVAQLVADGMSNREIAAELYVSHRTVETHVSHALTKLQVRSRTGIAKAALAQPDPALGKAVPAVSGHSPG